MKRKLSPAERRRTMAYYRIADGKIAVNDVMSDPDMMQVLGPLLAPTPD